jgi:hypothetical protein
MGVALLALAVALGGTAWAASKIGTSQIRNQAVTTAKLRNGSVTTPKIRNNAVNSNKIADYQVFGRGLRVAATVGPDLDAARTAAPRKTLMSRGPISLYAKCFLDGPGDELVGAIYVRTRSNFSIMEGDDDLPGGPAPTDYLNPNTPELDRELDSESTSGPGSYYNESEGLAAGPKGPALNILSGVGIKNGPVAANSRYGPGPACIFQGVTTG